MNESTSNVDPNPRKISACHYMRKLHLSKTILRLEDFLVGAEKKGQLLDAWNLRVIGKQRKEKWFIWTVHVLSEKRRNRKHCLWRISNEMRIQYPLLYRIGSRFLHISLSMAVARPQSCASNYLPPLESMQRTINTNVQGVDHCIEIEDIEPRVQRENRHHSRAVNTSSTNDRESPR